MKDERRTMHNGALRVTTLNILVDLRRWHERAPMIVEELRAIQPDLIALQEVALPANNAQWIADQLGGYSVHLCPKTGAKRRREALGILSRLPVEEHWALPLVAQDRVAQRVTIRHHGASFVLVNTHLYWNPLNDAPRLEQARRILDWIPNHTPAVVCGDFNAEPHFKSIAAMKARFASAHALAHGQEPEYTCPTLLARGRAMNAVAWRMLERLSGLLLKRTNDSWRGTVDYIFVDGALRVERCEVAFNRPSPDDERLYPSDHFGLMADIRMESK
jgi:endonuclease/exonuclease/phosphatase family metal-dependent hydrolase